MNERKSTSFRAEGEITAREEMTATIAFLGYYASNPDIAAKQLPHLLSVVARAADDLRALLDGTGEPDVYQYRIFDPEYDVWGGWENCSECEFELYFAESLVGDGVEIRKLYAATPPALTIPEAIPDALRDEIIDLCNGYVIGDLGAQEIWEACRDAMLNGGKP